MSKYHLKRIISCTEVPKLLIIGDRWDICGRNILMSILKTHLIRGSFVHYICYSTSPKILDCFDNDCGEAVKYYDFYSDPLQWKSIVPVKDDRSFLSVLNLSSEKEEEILVIDKLTCALKFKSEIELLRNINELKLCPSIMQILILCSEDVVTTSFIDAVKYLSSCYLSLQSTDPPTCNILIKRKSGKIIKSEEIFELNSKFELVVSRELLPDRNSQKSEEFRESNTFFETTFNLSITEDQKKAKSKVILPHTRVQLGGGHIHYIPDEVDDWDDEDPDDDLEI